MAVVHKRIHSAEPGDDDTLLPGKKCRLEDQDTTASSSSANDDSDTSSQHDEMHTHSSSSFVTPRPLKAYANPEFLNSSEARLVRVMCELEEPKQRMDDQGVDNIVMFFGSARAKPRMEYEAALQEAKAKAAGSPGDAKAEGALLRLEKQAFLIPIYEEVQGLARMLTQWSTSRAATGRPEHIVGTGGGPGMMTAANRGAALAGGRSVGFGISLPFEDGLNPYVTPKLGFEFHYFFTRKFWMSYSCTGLVVAPGGLGTCDELFELITLMQTGKMKRSLPVILMGRKFWNACINWEAFLEYGMISEDDVKRFTFADTAEEAFPHLVAGIEQIEAKEAM
uniref:Cytokinin riboside 5'-monophosphate phosphoribohydrolase n=1 Tax=Pyrodinium bahamense TaxID=73915 RepID=A0A6T8SDU8_9DINO|eukprot:CAMPEP_0179102600 /NCGR_PEP_ID=MMETSP0796-20121207/47495_1 /TAXON_ID=73915 /ORGANISM="Pyrodinium bahamense, Strain pbaha01" /LENGTH=336 /DNA_ID=CAMNT_0020800479 /DNA_START=78 /DNA_END=1088 /DNA_ORIENTATION=-